MYIDEEDIGDPASLPTRDGKPVLPGDEIEICGTCFWCRLRLIDKKTPYAACTEKVPPGAYVPEMFIAPVDSNDVCEKWKSASPEFKNYAEQLWFFRWRRRCANDFDCQMEEKKEREAEAQDLREARKEERQRGLPGPRIPKSNYK